MMSLRTKVKQNLLHFQINDNWYINRPLFNDAKYSTQLSESSMIGTSVLNISASLSDNGYKGCGFRFLLPSIFD